MKLKNVLVMNGPNLDMLGVREPAVYGTGTLASLEELVGAYAQAQGVSASFYQSNSEGKLIGKIHKAPKKFDAVIYNPGAHTHYSYAIRDAIGSVGIPFVEVHLSDISTREPFRAKSVTAPACVAQVAGRGFQGYCDALDVLLDLDQAEGSPVRLGEGYEDRYPHAQVIVAQADAPHADASQTGASQDNASQAGASQVDAPQAASGHSVGGEGAAADPVPASDTVPAAPAAERLARFREGMREAGADALLVRNNSNLYWLTGFDDVFDSESAHGLLVTPDQALIHTDSRYGNALREAAKRTGSPVQVDEARETHAEFVRDRLQDASACTLAIEDDISLAEFERQRGTFANSMIKTQATHGFALGLRAMKDASEIARMKAAQRITDAAFTHIIGFMKRGMTEREVQIELEDFMVRHGAAGLAFGSIVAAGANGASAHAIPGGHKLRDGECVVMDFGARAHGYCSDMTRTVFIGEPEGTMRDAWDTLKRANETVEDMLKPGVTGAEAHELAEKILEEGGFGGKMGHSLGHGVGIDIHEQPVLSPRNTEPLVAGNVVTVEPGIYLPGQFGMRLEDFGVITHEGYERFTQSTHDMVII